MTEVDRSIRRRRVLAALAGVGATAGLAGCSDSSGEGPSSDGPSESTVSSNGDDRSGGETSGGDNDSETGPGAGEEIDGISCSEFGSANLQSYGTADTPLVFGFDYPDTWSESGSSPDRRSDRYTVIVRSEIIDNRYQTFLTVGQWFEPITPEELEQEVSTEIDARSGSEEFEVTRTLEYAGETVDVYSTPEYPEGLTSVFWLPYESAAGLRYFRTIFRFGYSNSFIAGVEGSDVELYCESLFDDLADRIFPTIEPNPATAIASEL
ncbi:MAG: twin-arginine translocation signal domain-containing protein [Halapricum sp.]